MKRRVRKIVNFFAFNLLFFALYLNFIHKDNATLTVPVNQPQQQTAAFSGTGQAEQPNKNLGNKSSVTAPVKDIGEDVAALKLSIN